MIRVTVILKDLTEAFYEGFGDSIVGFNNLSDADKFEKVRKDPQRFPMRIATGQFRDAVELNAMCREPHTIAYQLQPRKGYKVAEFIFSKA